MTLVFLKEDRTVAKIVLFLVVVLGFGSEISYLTLCGSHDACYAMLKPITTFIPMRLTPYETLQFWHLIFPYFFSLLITFFDSTFDKLKYEDDSI